MEECYDDLITVKDRVVDVDEWKYRKGYLELKMGRRLEAEETFLEMMKDGSTEDYRVHVGYQCALLGLEGENLEKVSKASLKQRDYKARWR